MRAKCILVLAVVYTSEHKATLPDMYSQGRIVKPFSKFILLIIFHGN